MQVDWRRGGTTPPGPAGRSRHPVLSGTLEALPLPDPDEHTGLRPVRLFDARLHDVHLDLTGVSLHVEWSELEGCRFTQRVRPVLNEHGIAAQGSFGTRPSVYRGCTFERVRFKLLGGFSAGQALFEDCTFLNCRWEGFFAHDAWWVNNRFVGRMNGCVWFGADREGRGNVATGNDFTETVLTDNVGFRRAFPVADQTWPAGFTPRTRG